jgi:deoxyribonuclease V
MEEKGGLILPRGPVTPVLKHDWAVSPKKAREIQRWLSEMVSTRDGFRDVSFVGGADISIREDRGFAVCVVMRYPQLEIEEEVMAEGRIRFPYVPGLLTFREGPLLLRVLAKLKKEPDIIMFDGQGVAHPVGLGLASHMGVILGRPTIGCAKKRLVGEYREPNAEKGSVSELLYRGRRIGSVVRTRTGVKPVFISPGNGVSFDSSVRLVLDCARRYRLPEPTRVADISSRGWTRTGYS